MFCFIKNFHSLSNITKPTFKKNILLKTVSFLFLFKPKIIPNYRSRCVSIWFLERIDSYPIRLVSLSESERSNPSPLRKSCRKKICSNGNRRPIQYENWNGTIAIRYDGNMVWIDNNLIVHNLLINYLNKKASAEANLVIFKKKYLYWSLFLRSTSGGCLCCFKKIVHSQENISGGGLIHLLF